MNMETLIVNFKQKSILYLVISKFVLITLILNVCPPSNMGAQSFIIYL